jgi:hypothetical protein
LIVAQRVTQNATDNGSLLAMIDEVKQRCGTGPGAALADSGFFSLANLEQMEQQNIDGYVPDSNLACELNLGVRCRLKARAAAHRRMARQAAIARWPGCLCAAQSRGRTGLRSLETATWNEAIPHPRPGKSERRIYSRNPGLQHHTATAADGSLNRNRKQLPQAGTHPNNNRPPENINENGPLYRYCTRSHADTESPTLPPPNRLRSSFTSWKELL